MTRNYREFVVLALATGLVAGCGGGSSGGGTGGGGGNGGGGNQNPTTVTVNFVGVPPTVVAAKIGSGAFTPQTLNAGAMSLSIPSGTSNFGIAFVCPVAPGSQWGNETVIEGSTADATILTENCSSTPSTGTTGTLTGDVDATAFPTANSVEIAAQSSSGFALSTLPLIGDFSFAAPTGSDRVLVVAQGRNLTAFPATLMTLAARNFDNQTIPGALNGGNAVVLGTADATNMEPITYNNQPSGSAPSTEVGYEMNGNGDLLLAYGATSQYPAVPAGVSQNGDSYYFIATANAAQGASVWEEETASSGGPVSFTFPSPWFYAGPTPSAAPVFNLGYTGFSGTDGIIQSALIGWFPSQGVEVYISVAATANYQKGSTTIAIPDLSAISGFLPPPGSGTQVYWSADVLYSSAGVLKTLPLNSNVSWVSDTGTYTVP